MKVYNLNNVITIEGVTSGDAQVFLAERDGDNIAIYNKKTQVYDVGLIDYSEYEDFNGNTFASAIEAHAYMDDTFTSVTQIVHLDVEDPAGVPMVAVSKSTGDFDTIITSNFCDKDTWVVSTTDSTWKLEPAAGEILRVIKAEAQFEHDLYIGDPGNTTELYLDYYIWHPSYPGTPVLGKRIVFDSERAMFEMGNSHYHSPALPSMSTGLSTIIFDYANKLSFYGDETSLELARLELSLKDHIEPTGSYATVGFVVESETI